MPLKITKIAADPKGEKLFSVTDLLKMLGAISPTEADVLFFRGHSRHTYSLQPGIYRDPGWIENEDVLFKELILRCASDFSATEATFEALVRMQHYSLPTRLLDLTANPLVALYFSCLVEPGYSGEAGELLIFRIPKRELKYYDSDTVSVIANLSKRPKGFVVPPAVKGIKAFNDQMEIQLLLHEIRREKPYFLPKIRPEHLSSVVCVKPKLANARITRQDGAFFLFGIDGVKSKPATVPQKYLANAPRIVIPAVAKEGLLKQLRDLGITQGSLFPEIERVAGYIRALYKAKKAK